MKHLVLTLLCLSFLGITISDAQSPKVKWGDKFKKKGYLDSWSYPLDSDDDYFYVLAGKNTLNPQLFTIDKKMELADWKRLRFSADSKNLYPIRLVRTTSGIYACFVAQFRKERMIRVYTSQFKKGQFLPVKKIYEYPYEASLNEIALKNRKYSNSDIEVVLSISPDSTKVVFLDPISIFENDQPEQVSIAVFDAEMNLIWKKKQSFEYSDEQLDLRECQVADNGEVYLLAEDTAVKEGEKEAEGLGVYRLFSISPTGMQNIELDLAADQLITNINLYIPKDQESMGLVAGFYTTDEKKRKKKRRKKKLGSQGMFSAKVDVESGSLISNEIHPFDSLFFDGDNPSLRLYELLHFSDGSLGFLAEDYHTEHNVIQISSNKMRSYTTYHGDAIVLVKLDNNNTVEFSRIDKTYISRISHQVSYSVKTWNKKTYLIYNNAFNDKEKEKKVEKITTYTYLTVIDENGQIESEEVIFDDGGDGRIYARPLFEEWNGKLFVAKYKGRSFYFGTINL